MSAGVPTSVDAQIEARIAQSTRSGLVQVATPGQPEEEARYIIKYTSARFGGTYPPSPNAVAAPGLFISPSPGFTWGDGIYGCPVSYPLSGAIYGRCGIVAELRNTGGWRIFDATDAAVASLYVQWAQLQPMYAMLTLTVHANLANQLLRNLFKTRFRIDVVVFPPDEFHSRYTQRLRDRWLAISEWTSQGRLAAGIPARRPVRPQLTVILAEEFEAKKAGVRRQALIGPTSFLASMAPTPADVITAYRASNMLWVGA
jgi:hypothetical protein